MTLRRKLLIPTLSGVFLGFVFFVLYQVSSQNKDTALEMQAQIEHLSDLVAKANVSYVWNYDAIGLQFSLESMLEDEQITSIEILDSSGITLGKAEEPSLDNTFTKDIELERDGIFVGTAKIIFTDYHLREQASVFINRIISLEILLFLLIAFLITLTSQMVIKPIISLSKIMKDMAEGEADLTQRIPVRGNDEVARLSQYFNTFLDKLRFIVVTLHSVSVKSSESGEVLADKIRDVSYSSTQLSSSMDSMNKRLSSLLREISKSNESVDSINGHIVQVVDMIQAQAESVNESSSSVEQMISNVNMIENATEMKLHVVHTLEEQAMKLDKGMNQNLNMMEEASKTTELIAQMVSVINNVASKTNLLAMNAAIEAAHAGQYGKGFSVVADEIRKLAEQTATNARNIETTIKKVVSVIGSAAEAAKDSSETLGEVISGISSVAQSMNDTLSGLKEISAGNKRIIDSLTSLNTITESVKTAGSGMKNGTLEIDTYMKNILNTSELNKTGVNEMSERVFSISDSMKSLADLSEHNSQNIETLNREISKFKA